MVQNVLSPPLFFLSFVCLPLIQPGTATASIGNIKAFLDTCPKNDPIYSQIKNDFTIGHSGAIVPLDNSPGSEPVFSIPITQYGDELNTLQGLRVVYSLDYGQTGHLPWGKVQMEISTPCTPGVFIF